VPFEAGRHFAMIALERASHKLATAGKMPIGEPRALILDTAPLNSTGAENEICGALTPPAETSQLRRTSQYPLTR
jgi:hypothetical protein